MARGATEPPIEPEQGEALLLLLEFADGTKRSVEPMEAAAMLRGYAVPAPMFRSRRIYDLVLEFGMRHADYRLGGADAVPNIDEWDRCFMDRLDDTDILHDVLVAASQDHTGELMALCAKKTADMVRGGTVEEIKDLLGIAADDVTPEQDLLAQQDYDRLLRINP
ncbi:unnamed protein product [Alopecurus aequalis]